MHFQLYMHLQFNYVRKCSLEICYFPKDLPQRNTDRKKYLLEMSTRHIYIDGYRRLIDI